MLNSVLLINNYNKLIYSLKKEELTKELKKRKYKENL